MLVTSLYYNVMSIYWSFFFYIQIILLWLIRRKVGSVFFSSLLRNELNFCCIFNRNPYTIAVELFISNESLVYLAVALLVFDFHYYSRSYGIGNTCTDVRLLPIGR